MNTFRTVSVMVMMNLLTLGPVQGKGLGKSEDVEFQSAHDQTMQRYILRLPEDFDKDTKHDLLIALHGHGADRWQFAETDFPQPVATRDVAADRNLIYVSPDYRASTSWMGPAAEKDVVQIIRELTIRFQINRVFVCGGSMGGSSALTFAVLHPELIAGVAAMNPTANHLEYEQFQDAIAKSFGGTKKEIPGEYKKRSAEYWPEKVRFPVGITVGGKDTIVPPDSAIRWAAILQKLDKEVCLIHRPEMEHDTTYNDTRQILEFVIDKANQKKPSASSATPTGAEKEKDTPVQENAQKP